jgi:hypothetical protein
LRAAVFAGTKAVPFPKAARVNWIVRWPPTATGNPPAATSVARYVADSPAILFPIRQRRHGDFRVFRVGMMHRLGVVPQRLLREPFREAAFQRPLRPRIPITAKYTNYAKVL